MASSTDTKIEQTVRTAGRIAVSVSGRIGVLTIDNVNRYNAMSLAMWIQLAEALDIFEKDADLRCVIVKGEGARAFCSGADISEFEAMRSEKAATEEFNRLSKDSLARLQRFPKPTIAQISGYCMGGGVALAIACDLRIGAAGSRYGIPAARLGLGYDYPGIRRLANLVGPSKVKQIFFTARQFTAEEALAMGLIDELHAVEELDSAVHKMAGMIAANAPMTIVAAKYAAELSGRTASSEDIAQAAALEQACFDSQDYVEGRRAFMEKRPPDFHGR